MEVFWTIIDFITAVLFIVLFVGISWGAILRYKDKQAEWQDRKEYNAMKKNIEKGRKNDAARNRRL